MKLFLFASRANIMACVLSLFFIVTGRAADATVPPAPPVAPAPPRAPPKTPWKTTAALGITLTRGNSETVLGTVNVNSEKKWGKNEIGLTTSATYGEDHGVRSAESFAVAAQYNRLVSERTFFYGHGEGLHDAIANVEYRVSLSPGAGYYFIKNERNTLRAQIGPGYVMERLGVENRSYATLRLAERYELKFNARARFWQSLDFSPRVEDFGDYVANTEIGIATDITKSFGLRVFAQDTYRSQAAVGRSKNDLKLVAGVEYKF